MPLYLALLGSTTFNYGSTLAWLYLALSSSTTLYHGSTTFSHGYNSVYMNGVSMYMNIPTSYPPSGLMMNAIILAYFIYSVHKGAWQHVANQSAAVLHCAQYATSS